MYHNSHDIKDEIAEQTSKLAAIIRLQERRAIDRIMDEAGLLPDFELDEHYFATLNNLDRLMDLESE